MAVPGQVRLAVVLLLTVPGLEAYDYFNSGAGCAAAGCAALGESQCSSIANYKSAVSKSNRPPDCYRKNSKFYFNANTNGVCTSSLECVCSCTASPPPPPAAPCTWLRITTGTEADDPGTLDVAVNAGTGYSWVTQGDSFASGETVLEACYASPASVQIRSPSNDGWAGAVEYLDAGAYAPLECTSACSGGAQTDSTTSTARIFADGDDNLSDIAPATCANGATCTLTLPPSPSPSPSPPSPSPPPPSPSPPPPVVSGAAWEAARSGEHGGPAR